MTEFPLVLEDNAVGASYSIRDIQSGSKWPEYQDNGLDTTSMHTPSVENTGGMYNSE